MGQGHSRIFWCPSVLADPGTTYVGMVGNWSPSWRLVSGGNLALSLTWDTISCFFPLLVTWRRCLATTTDEMLLSTQIWAHAFSASIWCKDYFSLCKSDIQITLSITLSTGFLAWLLPTNLVTCSCCLITISFYLCTSRSFTPLPPAAPGGPSQKQ